jgi:hypothetical protein
MMSAGASFFNLMTRRVLPLADSSLTSAMPSICRVSTSSLIFAAVVGVAGALFDLGDRPQLDRAATGAERVDDALAAHDLRARREVGSFHELHQLVDGGLRVVDEEVRGIDHLTEVVRRDVRGHPDGDALAAVDQQVREATGQHRRLRELARVVRFEVDGVLVDAVDHAHRQRRQPALRVPRRGRTEIG